uniref:Uncharacterized protein n=1 Tax=Syphacia muris TaxID=451379 RepID=A0A0N5AYH8_9BILA
MDEQPYEQKRGNGRGMEEGKGDGGRGEGSGSDMYKIDSENRKGEGICKRISDRTGLFDSLLMRKEKTDAVCDHKALVY